MQIPEVRLVRLKKHDDHRGFFSEVYNKRAFAQAGIDIDFVQDNHSLSTETGTVRGLHFQTPPFAQNKLVRVLRGAVFDVAVDLRRGSPTYGHHVSAILSDREWNQMLIPIGFAHGFMTLEPNTEVLYKVSEYYAPEHDKGVIWDDPDIAVTWPLLAREAVLAEKDRRWPSLRELPEIFRYEASIA